MRLAVFVAVLAVTSAPRLARADEAAPRPWTWEGQLHAGTMPTGPSNDPAKLFGLGARGAWFLGGSPIAVEGAVDASLLVPECEQGDRFSASCDAYRLRALAGLRAATSPRRRTIGFVRGAAGVDLLHLSTVTNDRDDPENPTTTRDSETDAGPGFEVAGGFVTGDRDGRVGVELAVDVAQHAEPSQLSGTTEYVTIGIELRLVVAFGR
jgi:hypothetical protein